MKLIGGPLDGKEVKYIGGSVYRALRKANNARVYMDGDDMGGSGIIIDEYRVQGDAQSATFIGTVNA